MQNDAVSYAVSRLRGQLETDLDGIPIGQARGKIILPCGTGKTRISLRIVEELTPPGGLSVVLCPSIALVAQIRREYLLNSERPIRALAVCSDETAGYNPKKEDQRNTFEEVTADSSNVSADEIKGKVTTDPEEIARWLGEGQENESVSVIFGTYQSGHRIAEALRTSGTTAEVLICDEAHRTAGLRRTKKSTVDQIKDFTLCHDNDRFPAPVGDPELLGHPLPHVRCGGEDPLGRFVGHCCFLLLGEPGRLPMPAPMMRAHFGNSAIPIPAHPPLHRPVMDCHYPSYLFHAPPGPQQPQGMQPSPHFSFLLPSVPFPQCLRTIL